MNGNHLLHPPRQQALEFTRNRIGPRLSRAAFREVQTLLAQLLVEVVRREPENDTQRGEHERQDP